MDEEKKEQQDIFFKQGKSFFASENKENQVDAPVVKPDEREVKKDNKRKQKEQAREQRNKKYPDKLSFLLGIIVFIFAVTGVVLLVWNSVSFIKSTVSSGGEYAEYNEYLSPLAAVDPDPFDDITAADGEQLRYAAIWAILSDETTPDTYSYSQGYMLIPASDVEKSYAAIFGPETAGSITHTTVQGYNSTFEYDSAGGVYKIPVTTISPVYTPQVTDVEKSGTSLVVTVNYVSAESWATDVDGNIVAPAPDKVMKITLRELQGSYYVSAVQTVSSTVPETVSFEMPPQENTSESVQETTTAGGAEKTTLGGRI